MYTLQNNLGFTNFIFEDLTRKTFEEKFFSFEIRLEYVELSENDWFYYDEEDDEECYEITKEYYNFVQDFLNILDSDSSDEDKIEFFNNGYNPPYKHLQGYKLVKYNNK
jgi:hypothetical protein